jgi:arabinan endo-1,5-alpha-L-arabinosidase
MTAFEWTFMASAALLSLCAAQATAASPSTELRGNTSIHDPSTIVKHKNLYHVFGTGRGIISKASPDRINWTNCPPVFRTPPSWTTSSVPGFRDTFWAPDIIYCGGKFYLYYSVSTWGSQVSAIGLATNPSLDPADTNYAWADQGAVIESRVGSPYNTIDPSVALDAEGRLWMAFGSYWNGIYLVELDPATGKRISSNSPTYRLAYNKSIEAAGLARRGDYYYLFVNWGSCCAGVKSTYNIRVGRSANITGPYLDKNGVDLANNGGTLFMEGTGKYVGPGHASLFIENGADWLCYHYYDASVWSSGYRAFGPAKFDIVPLSWTTDGWPAYTNEWSAEYRFEKDATDSHSQDSGLLRGTAVITNDPVLGGVLELTGTNADVQLPPSVAYARTFSVLVKWNGGSAGQRIFDFGTDTNSYVMLTPFSGSGRLQCDIKTAGAPVESLQAPQPLPVGSWTHVAVTFDGQHGVLYVGGSPVATNSNLKLSPLDVHAQSNHLGRSKFAADPAFNGRIASFRAYGQVLTAAQLTAPRIRIEPLKTELSFAPGEKILLRSRVTDFLEHPLMPDRLTWSVVYSNAGASHLVLGPVTDVTNISLEIPSSGSAATSPTSRIRGLEMHKRL